MHILIINRKSSKAHWPIDYTPYCDAINVGKLYYIYKYNKRSMNIYSVNIVHNNLAPNPTFAHTQRTDPNNIIYLYILVTKG